MFNKKRLLKNKILKELYFLEGLSCAELSNKISKSFPITAKMIEELIGENMVVEKGFARSTGGRRPLTYALKQEMLYVVSVAMDQFVTKIAILDMENNFVTPVEKVVLPLPNNPDAPRILVEKIVSVMAASGLDVKKLVGVGIGMPGFVNVKKGINYSYLQVANKSIVELIQDRIGIPVFIDNDSSLIALAELKFGVAKGEQNAMVVNIGWGVGLGMILNGEMYRGHEGFAGEFSHIPLFLNGQLCACGKTGCLETETSMRLIIEEAREGINAGRLSKLSSLPFEDPELASEELIKAVREGDQYAIELFSKAGYSIGKGVAVLIHLLNPKTIILSGRGSSAGQIWKAPIQQALNEHCIPRLYQTIDIKISTLGNNAELIGAAALVMDNFDGKPEEVRFSSSVEMQLS